MGDCEAGTPVSVESPLKYHSGRIGCLTSVRDPDQGQCQVGSLTGAVVSSIKTEISKELIVLKHFISIYNFTILKDGKKFKKKFFLFS